MLINPVSDPYGWLADDSVEEVCFEVLRRRGSAVATMFVSGASPQVAEVGVGIGISMATFRRFWAVAARWNSSRAPFGPRNRSRSSFRMRLWWANSISTFLRWQREVLYASVLAISRAISRAPSWIERGIFRAGAFGQHCGFSEQSW